MHTFADLYKRIATSAQTKVTDPILDELGYDPYHLECVLNPELKQENWRTFNPACATSSPDFVTCLFAHLQENDSGQLESRFVKETCIHCLDEEKLKQLLKSKDIMEVLSAIHKGDRPVYVLIAPAFLSQFDVVTDGQLRSAFKQIGFKGVVEVSLFADILTLKEALDFDREIKTEKDYVLTSCCCPMWIQMIRKVKPAMLSHVPKSVSPMVACGRVVKRIVPNAYTVFVGPCLAKKAEAKEPDINDAVDAVLTFQEAKDIFELARIDATNLKTDVREHSSSAGRIYAIASGVSKAVDMTLKRLRPDRKIQVRSVHASGVPQCKHLLDNLEKGLLKANFIEGMGCDGGCVGGPRSLIDKTVAKGKVEDYSHKSPYPTPIDNPYVIEMLYRLNMKSVEDLLEDREIFAREF